MYSVVGRHTRVNRVGAGSNPTCIDQKENLLKVQDMKKQRKMNRKLSQQVQTVGMVCATESNRCSHR